MPHSKHKVYDTNLHYKIDPVSKAIIDQSSIKPKLMQHDHNSERRAFELPRYIGNHDMSLCNKIYIHYLIVDASTREENPGVYEVNDMQISKEDENTLIFSWLISREATKFAGVLSFLISFICEAEDGEIQYQWDTDINSERNVSKGMNNAKAVLEKYVDIIESWKKSIEQSLAEKTKTIVDEALEEKNSDISFNDLKDKPFFVGDSFKLEMDMSAPCAYRDMWRYHFVSDKTYTRQELIGATAITNSLSYDYARSYVINESYIIEETSDYLHLKLPTNSVEEAYIFVAYTDNCQPSGFYSPLPSKGVYFSCHEIYDNLYVVSVGSEGIVPIDNKFLDLANHPVIKDILARLSAAKI